MTCHTLLTTQPQRRTRLYVQTTERYVSDRVVTVNVVLVTETLGTVLRASTICGLVVQKSYDCRGLFQCPVFSSSDSRQTVSQSMSGSRETQFLKCCGLFLGA